jgi:hypothetical protein
LWRVDPSRDGDDNYLLIVTEPDRKTIIMLLSDTKEELNK